jgi:hypothetical protein
MGVVVRQSLFLCPYFFPTTHANILFGKFVLQPILSQFTQLMLFGICQSISGDRSGRTHLHQIVYYITHSFVFLLFVLHITSNSVLYYTFFNKVLTTIIWWVI